MIRLWPRNYATAPLYGYLAHQNWVVPDLFLRGLLSDIIMMIMTIQELNEAIVDEVAAADEG